jgi:FkbM family methyltransferase
MLIPLQLLIEKYNIQFKGILHVGAHECEELKDYQLYITNDKILWIEAMPDKVEFCKYTYPGIFIENAVILDKIEKVKFNISNNGQSSSILNFGLHSYFHPSVYYVHSFETETKLLKDIICKYDIDYNFINLDIQGVELRALKSMEEYLQNIDYIYTEVNCDEIYQGCDKVVDLDEYLELFGFKRVETYWTDCRWGDAFYIKKNLLSNT